MRFRYITIPHVVAYEIKQKEQEGYDVDRFKEAVDNLVEGPWENLLDMESQVETTGVAEDLKGIYNELIELGPQTAHDEPSSLEKILENSKPREQVPFQKGESELLDQLAGAWEGRCAGCLLGKPVEGWGGEVGKEQIEKYLKEASEYPLTDYFPKLDSEDYEIHPASEDALRESITHMIRDDDLDYPILNLNVLEENGRDFESADIVDFWLSNLSYGRTYTAERAAYKNFVNGVFPPESATKLNPYREWIGAQIRGDVFGWVNPGNPLQAAKMAYRDARISHRKNGIYGEMLVAAILAAAGGKEDASPDTIEEVIDVGLSFVPEDSRLRAAIENTRTWAKNDSHWQETLRKVVENYGHYHWIHTIPNAAIVVLSLIHGQGDFEDSICTSVMCGHDTDCNGATVGSIVGLLKGSKNLPDKWIDPLENRVDSIVIGDTENQLSDLARRTYDISKFR